MRYQGRGIVDGCSGAYAAGEVCGAVTEAAGSGVKEEKD